MYPFTKFLQLIEFCRYGDHRDTFGRYNLIALPFIGTGDKSVRNSLKQNFERLHVTTGRALACITFMTPPLRWQREHRQWMNVREGLTLEISTDEGRIESALRDRFVLPESGSYLLLTDSLDEKRYIPWADRICDLLKKGKADEVRAEIKNEKQYENCVNLGHYLDLHQDHIDYPEYIEKGYFIGSGAIESGNKVVLQKRLKQAGMRWEVESAQYLLSIKSKVESGLWASDVVKPVFAHYCG